MKPKRFFFHYNKPESQRQGKPIITLHFNKSCYLVENIECQVPTFGRIRINKQPHFVMVGKALNIQVINNVAKIT